MLVRSLSAPLASKKRADNPMGGADVDETNDGLTNWRQEMGISSEDAIRERGVCRSLIC